MHYSTKLLGWRTKSAAGHPDSPKILPHCSRSRILGRGELVARWYLNLISPSKLAFSYHRSISLSCIDDPPATRRQRHLLIPDHQQLIEIDDETRSFPPGGRGGMASGIDLSNATPNRVFTSFLPGTRFLSRSASAAAVLLLCSDCSRRRSRLPPLLMDHGIPWTMMMMTLSSRISRAISMNVIIIIGHIILIQVYLETTYTAEQSKPYL
jgi:hypothetical protein